MSPYGCPCQREAELCDDCVSEQLAQLKGVAQSRGENWARAVATVIKPDRPWPNTEKQRAGALRKVEDLTRDARLRELLANEVTVGAARWWNRALAQSG